MAITDFRGEYKWLSNFGYSPIVLKSPFITQDVLSSNTVEHLYQALKTLDKDERQWILDSKSPGQARRRGQKITLRNDWNESKRMIMMALIDRKFGQNPDLAKKLLETEDHHLVEGNDWGDTFWGVCDGRGLNHLGRILMDVRESLRNK